MSTALGDDEATAVLAVFDLETSTSLLDAWNALVVWRDERGLDEDGQHKLVQSVVSNLDDPPLQYGEEREHSFAGFVSYLLDVAAGGTCRSRGTTRKCARR